MFTSYKTFKHNFPNTIESKDNSWMNQQIFYNLNFTRKQPRKKIQTFLTPTFYGIPDRYHTLKVKDLYQNLAFKTPAQIQALTGTLMVPLNYSNLKAHVTHFIGHNKKYDAVVKEHLPQKEHTSSNTTEFIRKAVKGSGTIRKIIGRRHARADIHNPKRWRKKLDAPEVTRQQIKESITRLHSKYLDSHLADHLSRLKLGKTHLNAQLHHSNQTDNPHCLLCQADTGLEIQEDYKHALHSCPNSQKIIKKITDTLFPNITPTNNFTISDKTLSTKCGTFTKLKS